MTTDALDKLRQMLTEDINSNPLTKETLEKVYGKGEVFDTEELKKNFEVFNFAAPFVMVRRKKDGMKGTLEFQHSPRLYYSFLMDG